MSLNVLRRQTDMPMTGSFRSVLKKPHAVTDSWGPFSRPPCLRGPTQAKAVKQRVHAALLMSEALPSYLPYRPKAHANLRAWASIHSGRSSVLWEEDEKSGDTEGFVWSWRGNV